LYRYGTAVKEDKGEAIRWYRDAAARGNDQGKKYLNELLDETSGPLDYGYGTSDAPTVNIGTQTWMAKNLNVSIFANGDPIPEVKTNEEWKKAAEEKKPAWCYYENDPANGAIYGKLYNWYAVSDPRGLAPKGWHIPIEVTSRN